VEPDFDVIIPIAFGVFGLIVFIVLIAVVRAAVRRASGVLGGGAAQGLRARGLVLTCDRVSSGGVTVNGLRYERRGMTLDVEIPGRPPFVTTGTFLLPRGIVEALPGSSLELAVDSANQITVLGPGGFTGPWLNFGPPNTY
jgi:hypothetical protein